MYKITYKTYYNGKYNRTDVIYTTSELNGHRIIQHWNNIPKPNKEHQYLYTIESIQKDTVTKKLIDFEEIGIIYYRQEKD